jgi:hypothetical protein
MDGRNPGGLFLKIPANGYRSWILKCASSGTGPKGLQRFLSAYEARQVQWKQREIMLQVIEQQHLNMPPTPVKEKWLELMNHLQHRYPNKEDEKYVRAKIQAPLLLQEAEALEAVVKQWKREVRV